MVVGSIPTRPTNFHPTENKPLEPPTLDVERTLAGSAAEAVRDETPEAYSSAGKSSEHRQWPPAGKQRRRAGQRGGIGDAARAAPNELLEHPHNGEWLDPGPEG